MAVQPLLAVMSRIKTVARVKQLNGKLRQKAFGEQIIALTHRERPYMALFPFTGAVVRISLGAAHSDECVHSPCIWGSVQISVSFL
jgi:hypothetical protein